MCTRVQFVKKCPRNRPANFDESDSGVHILHRRSESQQLAVAAASLQNSDVRSVDDPAALFSSIFTCLIAGFCNATSPSIDCGLQGGPAVSQKVFFWIVMQYKMRI